MNFSAAASSSPVVVPARAFAASIFRQRTRIAPEAAIFSTSSGVFLMIIRYTLLVGARWVDRSASDGLVLLHPQRRQGAADLLGHLVRRHLAADPAQDAAAVVVGDQRLGLLVVGLQPLADHVGPVVVADDQLGAVDVADPLLLGRVELDVEDVGVLGAGAAAAEPADDLVVGDLDQQHRGHGSVE